MMTEILTIAIIDNGRGGHKDLLFSMPDLIGDKEFDTYYFGTAVGPTETINPIRTCLGIE